MTDKITHRLCEDYISIVFLMITNPLSILTFIAVFASIGLGNVQGSYLSAALVTTGVFLGGTFWWLALSVGVHKLRAKFTTELMSIVNKLAGIIIIGFSLVAWISIVQ